MFDKKLREQTFKNSYHYKQRWCVEMRIERDGGCLLRVFFYVGHPHPAGHHFIPEIPPSDVGRASLFLIKPLSTDYQEHFHTIAQKHYTAMAAVPPTVALKLPHKSKATNALRYNDDHFLFALSPQLMTAALICSGKRLKLSSSKNESDETRRRVSAVFSARSAAHAFNPAWRQLNS